MIELKVKTYCEDCEKFEPKIERLNILSFKTNENRIDTFISCKHASFCDKLVKRLEEKAK